MAIEHFAQERVGRVAEHHPGARLQLLARMHQRVPPIILELRQQKTFHGAAARRPMAKEARRKHSGVVDHEEIALAEELGQPPDVGMLGAAGPFMQNQELRCAALRRRRLRNQVRGQIEIEGGDVHDVNVILSGTTGGR